MRAPFLTDRHIRLVRVFFLRAPFLCARTLFTFADEFIHLRTICQDVPDILSGRKRAADCRLQLKGKNKKNASSTPGSL